MRSVIVTGATGFIGRYLVKELLQSGYTVFAVVRDADKARAVLGESERLHCIRCEMEQYGTLSAHTELRDVPLLFHLAWRGVSDQSSTSYAVQLDNVRYACDLQTAAVLLGIKRMVFADSIMEFEHQKAFTSGLYKVPLRNTYHVAKNAARNMLQLRAANMGIEFIPAVISNVYGVGEVSERLINTTVRRLLRHEHTSFTPSEQQYDFIYVTDAVRAIRLTGERGENNKQYYIGNRMPRPLKEFLYELRDVAAPGEKLGIGELPFNGVSLDYTGINTSALYEDFGFVPEISFQDGIRMIVESYPGGGNAL